MTHKKNTAGKRTARPGNRSTDVQSERKVKERRSFDSAGRKANRTTVGHIIAHQRADGRRRKNPRSKSK